MIPALTSVLGSDFGEKSSRDGVRAGDGGENAPGALSKNLTVFGDAKFPKILLDPGDSLFCSSSMTC